MCIYVYVYMYTYIHKYTHIHMYIYIYIYIPLVYTTRVVLSYPLWYLMDYMHRRDVVLHLPTCACAPQPPPFSLPQESYFEVCALNATS